MTKMPLLSLIDSLGLFVYLYSFFCLFYRFFCTVPTTSSDLFSPAGQNAVRPVMSHKPTERASASDGGGVTPACTDTLLSHA